MSKRGSEVDIPEARRLSEIYNKIRQNWHPSHEFSAEDLHEVFKNGGFPCGLTYIRKYPTYGLLIRKKIGVYTFPAEPVHFNVVGRCIQSIRRECARRGREAYASKHNVVKPVTKKADKPAETPVKPVEPEQKTVTLNVPDCIAFLKDMGYIILKMC